jgi:2-keto-3-deoxy-L-rhamnonate aldolase RhmA
VEFLFDLGFNFTAAGSDVGILARGAEGVAARFRKARDSEKFENS